MDLDNILLKEFYDQFSEDWYTSNVFRLGNMILINSKKLGYIWYNVETKQWSDDNYKELANQEEELIFCQPKQYVFRSTYLGYYLNTFRVEKLTSKDLNFLFPEYEFIVEQAMKLQIPFILNAFRQNSNNLIKNCKTTSLVKATELSVKQLNMFQERIQLMKNDAMYYFLRLNRFVPSFKGLGDEIFEAMCDIAMNDGISDRDLDLYQELILSKPGNIGQKVNKIKGYINSNFSEYRNQWNTLKEINKLDETEFPELPKAEKLSELIPLIQQKVIEYEDEALYTSLNLKYKDFIDVLKKFEYSEDKYCIIAPEVVQELDIEGNVLHHCVGTYKHNLAGGNEIILFLRRTEDPRTPFYTIDLDPEGYVRQIHTKYNGDIQNDPERDEIKAFLDNWANAKSDIVNKKSIKLNYSALCHI